MGKEFVIKAIKDIEEMAREEGLDFFPTVFEYVNRDIMLEACSYGLPVRARHWSYGRSYDHQKVYGEMGLSKVYEIVFNNDPSYAFLLDTNPDVINIMVGAHVFGHCIKEDQLVDTISGPKKISNIVPGDMVMTHTGNFKKVLVSRETTKTKNFYSIKTYGYPEIQCTSDHRFYIKRGKKNVWVMAKDLLDTDLVAIPRYKPKDTLSHVSVPVVISRTTPLGKKALAKTGGYKISLDYNFGRIVGLYLAEGSISVNRFSFTLGSEEIGFVRFIQEYFTNLGITVRVKRRVNQNCIDVQCFDKSMSLWFDENFGHGCENKKLPEFLMNSASDEFYKGLLRGYFEGDGWVKDGFTYASASTTSINLAYQIKNICTMFGVKVGIRPRNRLNKKPSFSILVSGKNYDDILSICDINRSNIPKRRWLFNEVDDDFIYNRIRQISILKSDKDISMWDLEVEDDHSFVLSNGMVAHNCHFFKHNIMFQGSDRNMIHRAAERAARVDEYIEQYGLEKVEHLMDIAFALDNHIDWNKGLFRKKYPKKKVIEEKIKFDEFEDLLNIEHSSKRSIRRRVVGGNFPPHPEKDLLWFLSNYANLEEWEKDVLGIIREESYYFYPIVMTKIMNEGFASFWHAELMFKYDGVGEQDHIEFCKCHAGVVNPGSPFSINPYYLGFKVFTDIRKRWDALYERGESDINGIQKIIQVAAEEDDASFLRNYLTKELAEEMGLFNFGYRHERQPGQDEDQLDERYGIIELKDRDLDKVIENIVRPTINYGAPLITIDNVDGDVLVLNHRDNFGPLDEKYTEKTMGYIYELWGGPIELNTSIDENEVTYCFDESGFDIL